MIDKVQSLAVYGQWLATLKDPKLARVAHRYRECLRGTFSVQNGELFSDLVGLTLDPERHAAILEGLMHVESLKAHGQGKWIKTAEGDILFEDQGVRVKPKTAQEVYILDEIFGRKDYGFELSGWPLVWDIGMNVGVASLYFAGVKGWEVIGYEPVEPTYLDAQANFALNPGLAGKIKSVNAGLGKVARTETISYNERTRGSNSLYGNQALDRQGAEQSLPIKIVAADEAWIEILTASAGRPIVMKIDCEGAEYEVFESLDAAGAFKVINVVLMEYHMFAPEHQPEILIETLKRNGFAVRYETYPAIKSGTLFAVRTV